MRSVKRSVFRTAVVLVALFSFYSAEGRTKDAKVGWRDEWNRYVDERIDAKMTMQLDSKIQMVDERYRIRERDVVGLCEKEIDFLTNKVNFLGILLTFAGVVAVAVPIYAGLKIRASFENSRAAIARAKEAIAKVESTRAEGLKSRAQWNFVNSKNSFRQYIALTGKFTEESKDFIPNTVGALFVGIEEMRKNFVAQSIVFIERAIAYNIECKHYKAVRANLVALNYYLSTIQEKQTDDNWLRRKLHACRWTCSTEQIREAVRGSPQGDKGRRLVECYVMASEAYGSRVVEY